MTHKTLVIAMVGLPAMGKSTIAKKLVQNLSHDHIKARIFNNGDVRRATCREDTSQAGFYDPANARGVALREAFALTSIRSAQDFLASGGQVAILDATNVSRVRRRTIEQSFQGHPVLFIECENQDEELISASIERKIKLPEFGHLRPEAARASFRERIGYYRHIHSPLRRERNFIRLDSLNNIILEERIENAIPNYERIRDVLVTDAVTNLYLVRHGESVFNTENRIGGDAPLTNRGRAQAEALATHFQTKRIPYIFTSRLKRAVETAEPILARQLEADREREDKTDPVLVRLAELDEIGCGACDSMTYEEVRQTMPEVFESRRGDKYNYVYPGGESYATLKERVDRGLKKAIFLSGSSQRILIIGHQAVNRMILSHFLFRRQEDVPYIYVPQDKYFHIISTQAMKLFRLKPYSQASPHAS